MRITVSYLVGHGDFYQKVYLLISSKRPEEKESKSYIITFGMFQKKNVLFDTYMI